MASPAWSAICSRMACPSPARRSTVDYCQDRLFPDVMFADPFTDVGRRSVPPMIVAV
ncbi:hypothetical protein [Actinophytocola sp.]|uniref:hypothetical protein n=1 Tax=Actinophytocola sp. TaxID=1872138 RepID=UPI0025C63A0A|nr:hypothetical protein [Actinophytocola sp.]